MSGDGSAPPSAIACSRALQSASERAIGPAWSSVTASGTIPPIGTRPWVGLIALMPDIAAGMRTEPAVSVPVATGTIRAASAAADPPLDPPADRARSHGLPTWSVVPPNANSCVCVCPTSTMLARAQPRPHDRVLARDVALEHPARRRHRQPGDGVEVLQADRHAAEQRRVLALARQAIVGGARHRLRLLGVHARPRVDGIGRAVERRHAAVALLDPGEDGGEQLARGQTAGAQLARGLERAEVRRVGGRAHPASLCKPVSVRRRP